MALANKKKLLCEGQRFGLRMCIGALFYALHFDRVGVCLALCRWDKRVLSWELVPLMDISVVLPLLLWSGKHVELTPRVYVL